MKDEVKLMAPASDEIQVYNLGGPLEAAMALNSSTKLYGTIICRVRKPSASTPSCSFR